MSMFSTASSNVASGLAIVDFKRVEVHDHEVDGIDSLGGE